jgi:poly-gamma-glutamate capsule biosynthesis protein CapA/YwtB (metallophosphatase superfamily)
MDSARRIQLLFGGDVMLGRGVTEQLQAVGPEKPWGDLLPLWRSADLRLVNLECPITRHSVTWSRSPKPYHLRADPLAVDALAAARVDACSLANNHILDYEERGLVDTLAYLDRAGIRHAGAGRDLEEARAPAMLQAGGHQIAVIAFTDREPAFAATSDRPGASYLPTSTSSAALGALEQAISDARAAGADRVIVTDHWGKSLVQRPSQTFRQFARAAIDLGADVFHGHGPHLFHGVELYEGRWILYSTGSLIDDYAVDPLLRNDWSFLFKVTMNGAADLGLELFPLRLSYAAVELAKGLERELILDRMERLSLELHTPLTRMGDHLAFGASTAQAEAPSPEA